MTKYSICKLMHAISRNQLKSRPSKFLPPDRTYKHTPAQLFSTNDITFDWFPALWLDIRGVNGRNFVVNSYAGASEETKMVYALDLQGSLLCYLSKCIENKYQSINNSYLFQQHNSNFHSLSKHHDQVIDFQTIQLPSSSQFPNLWLENLRHFDDHD